MQNKPNFDKGQNKPNPLYKKDLRKFYTPSDNEKRTQNKPNFRKARMNLNFYLTKDYENELCRKLQKNKPNQTQSPKPRHWRTRKDPFEAVWYDVLCWLQRDPDVTAKVLFERLQDEYPRRFPDGQLRTLQRRVREWRKIMARKLVYACIDGNRTY